MDLEPLRLRPRHSLALPAFASPSPASWPHTDWACSVPQEGPSSAPVEDPYHCGAWPLVTPGSWFSVSPTSLLPGKMFLVGLTGGIASGKSSVIQVFQQLGCAVIDVDVIARHGELWAQLYPAAPLCFLPSVRPHLFAGLSHQPGLLLPPPVAPSLLLTRPSPSPHPMTNTRASGCSGPLPNCFPSSDF